MLVLILIGAARARDEMIAGRALTWPLLIGVLLMLAGSAYLWTSYELRPRRGQTS